MVVLSDQRTGHISHEAATDIPSPARKGGGDHADGLVISQYLTQNQSAGSVFEPFLPSGFFFLGSAKYLSSLNYSIGSLTKNCSHRPTIKNTFLLIRDPKCFASIAFHSLQSRDQILVQAIAYHSPQAKGTKLPYRLIGRRGPFRVRAFVCVRCPRIGRPRRCRMPR